MAQWSKAIPESRDQLQSKILVWCVAPLLAAPSLAGAFWALAVHHDSGITALKALCVSLTFGIIVWALRSATLPAAICGTMICFLIILGSQRSPDLLNSGLAPLLALFLLTFAATRSGRLKKAQLGLAEGKRGRSASQVIANLGVAALVLLAGYFGAFDWLPGPSGLFSHSVMAAPILMLAALCEATADTVSSEIGQAFGGTAILITSLRRVPPGTDGAVSLVGSLAGILGAFVVAIAGWWALRLDPRETAIALVGGLIGWLFDSVLGATIERRGWVGNDLVNFTSTAIAAAATLALLCTLP